jgi:hypothetical protein
MDTMQKRHVYIGIGILALAAALALPVIAQPRIGDPRGGWGPGGMHGGGMMGGGWMGGPRVGQAVTPVTTIDGAASRAREALAGYPGDLAVTEVMEFSNHFYVLVKEKSTGRGALELIVERNGFVHPEPGPNMMWNAKYGHMAGAGWMGVGRMGGGRMGGPTTQPATPQAQPITPDRAQQLASQYLAQAFPGSTLEAGTAFYGYFTFDFERGGKIAGMLSVNAYTGQVWFHTWHGAFVAEREF